MFLPMKPFSQYHMTNKTNASLRNLFSKITFSGQNINVQPIGKKLKGSFDLKDTPLAPGIYMVKIHYQSHTFQSKLIIQS